MESLTPVSEPSSVSTASAVGHGSERTETAALLPDRFEQCLRELVEVVGGVSMPLRQIATLAISGTVAELQAAISSWLRPLVKPKDHGPRRAKPQRSYGQRRGGRDDRASNYKKAQDLFRRDPAGLVDTLLQGVSLDSDPETPSVEGVESLFGGIFETPSVADSREVGVESAQEAPIRPITVEQVKAAKRGWQNSAPGLDGIRVADVKALNNIELAILFNALLGRRVILPEWRQLRTTLVHKSGDRKDPANWRPITIGSAVQRLLHRVLLAALKSQHAHHEHQRGFARVDGTLANVVLLDTYIRYRKAEFLPFNVVSLDIRKAFDTVSHHSIRRALARAGVNPHMGNYILDGLEGATTTIKVGRQFTRPINLLRGVKQGDPLSPFIFNLVVDELLGKLDSGWHGGTLPRGRASCMAFADDLVLLADKARHIRSMLGETEMFFGLCGMSVNPAKCVAMATHAPREGNWPQLVLRSIFNIDGAKIPQVSTLDTFKYLGQYFGPTGLLKPSVPHLREWLERVIRAPLKPDQKLIVVKTYLIPRLLFGLQNTEVTGSALKDADRLIKRTIKRILHLSTHTPDHMIHASVRDGGLGVPELRRVIPQQLLARLTKILNNTEDPVVSGTVGSEVFRRNIERISNLAGACPASQVWREALASGAYSKGLEKAAEDSSSRSWVMTKPNGWSGRDYVRAIQLRTNNLPSKGLPYSRPSRCRGTGCLETESIPHILQ